MTFKVQVVIEDETLEDTVSLDLACFEREELSAETLGLKLAEKKAMLKTLQKLVVQH